MPSPIPTMMLRSYMKIGVLTRGIAPLRPYYLRLDGKITFCSKFTNGIGKV